MNFKLLLKNTVLYLVVVAISITLCSCSTKGIYNSFKITPKQFNTINNKIFNWTIEGKISWHDQRQNSYATCYVNWKKLTNTTQIKFQSALNLEKLVIEAENNDFNNKIKILSHNGKVYDLNDQQSKKDVKQSIENQHQHEIEHEQIQKTINAISLNINYLNYWLLGIPNPLQKYRLTTNGFTQHGWNITYNNYQPYDPYYEQNNKLMLPTKIVAINKKLQTTIKVIILKRLFP